MTIKQDDFHTPHIIPEPDGLHGAVDRVLLKLGRDLLLSIPAVIGASYVQGHFAPELFAVALSLALYRGVRDVWPAFKAQTPDVQ